MNKKNTYLLACIALFLIWGVYYFVKDEPTDIVEPQQQVQPKPKLVFSGNKLVEEKDGKTQWEISAETIEMDAAGGQAVLKTVTAKLYQSDGGIITMKAGKAAMDSNTHDIIMDTDVQVTDNSANAAKVFANQLKWSSAMRRIYGSGGVKIVRDDTIATGEFLESDEQMKKVKVWGNAHITKGVKQ